MTEPVANVLRIPIDRIVPGPNARGDVGDVTELAASLKNTGQQIPVIVVPIDGDRWQLLDGHRRRAAAVKARLPCLDAIVRRSPDDAGLLVVQLAIQGGARSFSPMAESQALHTLMFQHNLTREQIAARIGRSPAWVRDRISLAHLEPREQADLVHGRMSVGEALLRLKSRRERREGRPTPAGAGRPPGRRAGPVQRPGTRSAPVGPALPDVQARVLACLADGLPIEETAERLSMAPSTVKTHRDRLYERLRARNAPHAIHLAYQSGLLTVDGDRA